MKLRTNYLIQALEKKIIIGDDDDGSFTNIINENYKLLYEVEVSDGDFVLGSFY